MKERVLTILICAFLFSSCGDESGDEQVQSLEPEALEDSIPTLNGRFIFLSDQAILKGENFIYGVTVDSLARDLAEKVKPYKTENFDMVPVSLKAKIIPGGNRDSWDKIIEIREVLKIADEKTASQEALEE
ncbi:hypothetical protein [Salinimicrobium sp. GXAS 041]|uniref:hypothetical protein n=1 Tax=Salinimicrobium sp. GXAS 041 TaxID=3400806 RepID=UPI003C7256D1